MRSEVKDIGEIVARVRIHGLSQTYIGPNGRAKEVEDPERGDNAAIQFSVDMSGLILDQMRVTHL